MSDYPSWQSQFKPETIKVARDAMQQATEETGVPKTDRPPITEMLNGVLNQPTNDFGKLEVMLEDWQWVLLYGAVKEYDSHPSHAVEDTLLARFPTRLEEVCKSVERVQSKYRKDQIW